MYEEIYELADMAASAKKVWQDAIVQHEAACSRQIGEWDDAAVRNALFSIGAHVASRGNRSMETTVIVDIKSYASYCADRYNGAYGIFRVKGANMDSYQTVHYQVAKIRKDGSTGKQMYWVEEETLLKTNPRPAAKSGGEA